MFRRRRESWGFCLNLGNPARYQGKLQTLLWLLVSTLESKVKHLPAQSNFQEQNPDVGIQVDASSEKETQGRLHSNDNACGIGACGRCSLVLNFA